MKRLSGEHHGIEEAPQGSAGGSLIPDQKYHTPDRAYPGTKFEELSDASNDTKTWLRWYNYNIWYYIKMAQITVTRGGNPKNCVDPEKSQVNRSPTCIFF